MALFGRKQTDDVRVSRYEPMMERAHVAFAARARPGETVFEDCALGFPQVPDGPTKFARGPLSLAVVTDLALAFADPNSGETLFEYPISHLAQVTMHANGEWLLRFDEDADLVRIVAFAPLYVSDLPEIMTATVSNGVAAAAVREWEKRTGREWDWTAEEQPPEPAPSSALQSVRPKRRMKW